MCLWFLGIGNMGVVYMVVLFCLRVVFSNVGVVGFADCCWFSVWLPVLFAIVCRLWLLGFG